MDSVGQVGEPLLKRSKKAPKDLGCIALFTIACRQRRLSPATRLGNHFADLVAAAPPLGIHNR